MPSDRASAPPPTISVLLPLPLEGAYDYLAPEEVAAEPGRFVVVPLGNRHVAGVAWGTGKGDVAPEKLKYISAVLDLPPLTDELRALIDWTANYTLNPPGAVLRMAMSIREALEAPRPLTAYRLADGGPAGESPEPAFRLTNARRRVLEFLGDDQPRTLAAIAEETGAAASVVHGLAGLGVVETVALSAETHPPVPDWRRPGPLLSPPQAVAARDLVGQLGAGSVTLLDGVTGSGKTEVYFEAIAAALAQGRQVCVLLPEIALTAQVIERFTRRFGVPPVEWHSDVPRRERRGHWRAILRGEARIVVGARSALFLPYRDLGLIVVDEEHDQSFKQEDGVIYNARDMAVVRGHLGGFPVVLVSATPSLETVVNGWSGRYRLLRLPDRHAGALPPRIEAVDLRKHDMTRQSWISPPLRDALAETLAAGEQSMLFLNRRGYAPLTLCRACGHRLECPNCTAWLVEHRLAGRLMCHHCGYAAPQPESCPECGAVDRFAACGPGVERVAEEAAALLPEARIAVMASDTLSRASAAAELIRRMQAHDIDLLIGTQIVAKGHHFPMLTLVGVIDADLGLSGGDLRASERTYQLLHQVAGRAGREDRPGRVLLQTTDPDHPVMKALVLGDRDGFIAAEAAERKAAGMPPFGRLASILITGPDADAVDAAGRALARTAPRTDGIAVLGPAPAPLAVVRGRHRVRLLVKAPRETNLQPHLRRWLRQVRIRGSVRVQVDVDPYAFH